ncbi:MAG: hypothetical protein ACOCZV_02265 [Nanoarchaeota archaeon]
MAKKKLWFHTVGYKHNPFTIKPGFFDDEVIGYDDEIDKIVEKLENGDVVYLEGEYGQGKTTILTYVINEFSGSYKVARVHRSRKDRAFNYEKLLIGAGNAFKRAFGMKKKNVILIVDEANNLNKKDCDAIEKYYESGHFKAVLLQDNSFSESNITTSLKKKIGKNVIKLKKLSADDAINLVRSRLENGKDIVSDSTIKEVFSKSKKNTRQFLENMEDVCRHAIENGREKVTEEDVKIMT